MNNEVEPLSPQKSIQEWFIAGTAPAGNQELDTVSFYDESYVDYQSLHRTFSL